jgi:hypothetical protein
MSAEKFVALFKNSLMGGDNSNAKAYSGWKINNKTWLNYNRRELEDMGLSKKVGFALTAETAEILNRTEEFNELVKEIKADNPRRGPFLDESNGTAIVIFPGVPFEGGIEKTLDKFLGIGSSELAKEIGLVKGHVFGIATGAVIGVKESLEKSSAVGKVVEKEVLDSALEFLDVLTDHLRKLDIESSTIKNFSSNILSKYNKSSRHFLVELQLDSENSESAKLVQKLAGRTVNASTGIRGLMNPGGHQKNLIKEILGILKAQGLTDPEKLIKFESSPPMIDLITDDIVSAISGNKKKYKDKYTGEVKVGKITTLYVNEQAKQKYRNDLKKLTVQTQLYKTKLKKRKAKRITPGMTISNLESILRSRLAMQIKENMGTGNAQNVLNYRTGRFAESATIERATQSRAGMVSVFYNYMRNPYGTFSDGGKQQYPRSRDPKILISKSIREIGATLAFNRMRAILV